jgi:predicted HAD superfamily hydrolase
VSWRKEISQGIFIPIREVMQKVCTMTTKDAYILLESAHFLKDDDLVQPITPEDTETRRRIIDFVHEIDTARFMLAMSFKDPYLDLVEEKDFHNKFKTEYFKQHYLYSAVIWYHNSFDLVLQCLWFKYRLYGDIQLRSDNIERILRKCGIVQIEKLHYKGKTDNPITNFCERNKNVHELANRLKHRQYLENDNYLLYAEFFNVLSEGYNSDETKVHVKLDDIQGSLMKYHKDLIGLAKELLIPIHKSISNAFID